MVAFVRSTQSPEVRSAHLEDIRCVRRWIFGISRKNYHEPQSASNLQPVEDESLPTFHGKSELLQENSGWSTTGPRRHVRVGLAPHARTSPCMGPLRTALSNFNISSSQQRSGGREEEKPSAK